MSDGVSLENVVCCNNHGKSGEIMERCRLGGYECPECGRHANVRITWSEEEERVQE